MEILLAFQLHEIVSLASSFLLAAFGLYVLFKSPRRPFNWALSAFALGIAGYNVSLLLLPSFPTLFLTTLLLAFILALFVPGLLLFIRFFPPPQRLSPWFLLIVAPDLFFLLLLPFGFIMGAATVSPEGNPIRSPGPLFPFSLAYGIGVIGYALGAMFNRWRHATGLGRLRMEHVFFWFGLFLFVIAFFGLILPTFGIYQFNLFSPLFSSLLLVGLLWSGIRSRLFDIRTIAARALTLLLLFLVVAAIISAPLILIRYLLLGQWPDPAFTLIATVMATLGLTFVHPLEQFLFRFIQKNLFPQLIVAEKTLEVFHRSSVAARTYADLGQVLLKIIPGVIPIQETAVLYRSPKDKGWAVIGMRGFAPERLSRFLAALRDEILLADEVETVLTEEETHPALRRALQELDAGAFIPVVRENRLLGALILGMQPALDAYSKEEIMMLEELTKDIAIVLENVQLWEEQKMLTEKLQASYKVQGEFISVVAHQFRTPLSVMRWNGEILYDTVQREVPPEKRITFINYLIAITDNAQFLINVLEDLFETMAIDEGGLALQRHPEPLWEIVAEVVKEYHPFASAKNVGLDIAQNDKELRSLNLDRRRIKRAVSVIVHNAIEYGRKSGRISVAVDPYVREGKSGILVSVQDAGIGISKNEQPRIFEKFFRGSAAKEASPNGTGLGLYVAKHIVEAHGGTLWFTSEERKGSTFCLFLPVA